MSKSESTIHISRRVRCFSAFRILLALALLVSWGGVANAARPSLVAADVDEPQQAVTVHYERGMRAIEMGLYDQAVVEFQRVLQLQPLHAEAYCQLGAA